MPRPRKNHADPAGRRRTIWHLQRMEQKDGRRIALPDGGVVSPLPNCGYDEETLKTLQKAGYRMKTEDVTE